MAQAEVPALIHSEVEREEMLQRMVEISNRPEISAEELEDISWLILERDAVIEDFAEGGKEFNGYRFIPDSPLPVKYNLRPAERGRYFNIELVGKFPLEHVTMTERDGSLRWHVGMVNSIESMYSRILDRMIPVEGEPVVTATDPLTDMEHASLAKSLVAAYQEGLPRPV